MADERDPVSKHYRELGAEEPPRHIDEAILAASRRAADVHPAPLVPPTGRRRWYFPVAAAAIIMLSVAVTWHMQPARLDPDGYVASAPAPEAIEEKKAADETLLAQRRDAAPRQKLETQPAPAAKAFTPDPRRESRNEAVRDARTDRALGKISEVEPPEKWLERIAELRRQGQHDEADKALEEFRKRYPGHKIPETVLRLPK